jgi:DNA-binding MarR family transcriptional regulator
MTNLDMISTASNAGLDFATFSIGKRQRAGILDLQSLILTILHSEDALRMEQLSERIGIVSSNLRRAMKALITAGAVVSSGRTRGTVYCAVDA